MSVRKLSARDVAVRNALRQIEAMVMKRALDHTATIISKRGLGKRYRSSGRTVTVNFHEVRVRRRDRGKVDYGDSHRAEDDVTAPLHNFGWGRD